MSDKTDHSVMAALSICEALLLALNNHKILPEHEIVGICMTRQRATKMLSVQPTR